MTNIIIYTLTDPRDNLIKYVGKTKDPIRRVRHHFSSGKKNNNPCNTWTKKLSLIGTPPIFEILDIVSCNDWQYWEKYWIAQIKAWGFNLKNISSGGESGSGRPPWNKGLTYVGHPNQSKPGSINPFYNKQHSCKTKTKISSAKKGIFYTTKKSKAVKQFDLDDNLIKNFNSLSDAQRVTGISKSNIYNVCIGKRRQASGFKWSFII